MNQEWLNEIEEAVIEFNEDCIIPKQIILEIISSLRHECEQLQAEQQAYNVLKDKLDNIIDDVNCEICLLEEIKDNGIVSSAVMHLKQAIKEDSK